MIFREKVPAYCEAQGFFVPKMRQTGADRRGVLAVPLAWCCVYCGWDLPRWNRSWLKVEKSATQDLLGSPVATLCPRFDLDFLRRYARWSRQQNT